MQKLVALHSPFGFVVVVSSGRCEQLMGARSQSRSAHFLEWPYAEDQEEVDIVENAIRSPLLQPTYLTKQFTVVLFLHIRENGTISKICCGSMHNQYHIF